MNFRRIKEIVEQMEKLEEELKRAILEEKPIPSEMPRPSGLPLMPPPPPPPVSYPTPQPKKEKTVKKTKVETGKGVAHQIADLVEKKDKGVSLRGIRAGLKWRRRGVRKAVARLVREGTIVEVAPQFFLFGKPTVQARA
jgi:hypothetical protein